MFNKSFDLTELKSRENHVFYPHEAVFESLSTPLLPDMVPAHILVSNQITARSAAQRRLTLNQITASEAL